MRRYIIRYRDESPESPMFALSTIAHDAEDAEERFFDSPDADGWVIVSIAPEPREGDSLRQNRAAHERDAKRRRT
jgi:hypothetical protein